MCASLNSGVKSCSSIGLPFSARIVESDEPPSIVSSSASTSTPVWRASTSPCASVAQLTAVIACEITFTACPWPASPQTTIFSPMISNSGRARSMSASAPPTMIVSVPVRAFGEEPVTGASTNAWPASRSRSSSSRAVPGAIVDMSTKSVFSRAPGSAWSIMSSTWAPSTTIVITTSEASATARRRVRDRAAVLGDPRLGLLARPVEDRQLVARLGQVHRLERAHDPEPDEADLLSHSSTFLNLGLRVRRVHAPGYSVDASARSRGELPDSSVSARCWCDGQ